MAPTLIHLNGLPASGKSTLARRWCALHAAELPLLLDIDAVRAMLGGWPSAVTEAGLAARDIAVAAAAVHLRGGRDVIVPQYLQRPELLDRLATAAEEAGARSLEALVEIGVPEAEERFRRRAAELGDDDPHGALHDDMPHIAAAVERLVADRAGTVRLPAASDQLALLEAAVRALD